MSLSAKRGRLTLMTAGVDGASGTIKIIFAYQQQAASRTDEARAQQCLVRSRTSWH